jgi:polyhydroxybutyrate depolymerase
MSERLLPLLLLAMSLSGCGHCMGAGKTCQAVDGGRYLAEVPPDWDGAAPLEVVVFFHGYSGTASSVRDRLWKDEGAGATGRLFVFPDGLDRTWSHVGSPSSARDELAFFDAVMADVRERWPVGRVHASGFSQGGSMAWDIACYRGEQLDTAFPASGAFWEPLPERCDTPVALRHTHGLSDSTVPMEGRPIGSAMQGDVREGLAIWQEANGCAAEPDEIIVEGPVSCEVWSSCSSGRPLWLCLHDGGHRAPSGWLERNLSWAEGSEGANR